MTNRIQPHLPLGLGVPSLDLTLKPGASRAYSGVAMEEVLRGLLSLQPGLTNGTAATCPDGYTHLDRPVEMKSLRKGGKLVVYDWRMAKDIPSTLYIIGVHNRTKCGNLSDIWEKLSKTLHCVFILGAHEVAKLAYAQELNAITTQRTASGVRNGYQRKGYKEGYRNVPYGHLMRVARVQLPFLVSCSIHGLDFRAPVFFSNFALHGDGSKVGSL